MTRRQTKPEQWLIAQPPLGKKLAQALRKLPRGRGVLVLGELRPEERRYLRQLARWRGLTVATEEPRNAARVHNLTELRQALFKRTPLILLSPLYPTPSHPDWQPLRRMRAAALARLAKRRLAALGGMNEQRFRRIQRLGFVAWAGISAFRI
jgi:hypothetical protein